MHGSWPGPPFRESHPDVIFACASSSTPVDSQVPQQEETVDQKEGECRLRSVTPASEVGTRRGRAQGAWASGSSTGSGADLGGLSG